jgi:peptidoglycan/LPS O-acetylase OafA/YrhL
MGMFMKKANITIMSDTQLAEPANAIKKLDMVSSSQKPRSILANYTGFTRQLLILNGLAIIGVVIFHSTILGFRMNMGMDWTLPVREFGPMGILPYYGLRIVQQLSCFPMPAFLMISGYFITFAIGRIDTRKQWNVILIRIKNIAIPLIIWSVLLLSLDIIRGIPYTPVDFILTIITGRASSPYYYVISLIQFLALSPILVYFAKLRPKALLIIAAVTQFVFVGFHYDTLFGLNIPVLQAIHAVDTQRFFMSRILYFTFGVVAGLYFPRFSIFRQKLVTARWWLLVSFFVFFAIGIAEWEIAQYYSGIVDSYKIETIFNDLCGIAFVFCFFAFIDFAPKFMNNLERLGGMSFGIYLIHWPVQEYFIKFFLHIFPGINISQLIIQPILIVCGLGLPIIFMVMVDKSPVRRYYRYLFG